MIRRLIILLLIVGCEEAIEPAIEGCIYDTACDYNADATKDDGSCNFTTCAGCMDTFALNYDDTATINSECNYGISGQVKDSNGNSVKDAAIIISYNIGEEFNIENNPYANHPPSSCIDIPFRADCLSSGCTDEITIIIKDKCGNSVYESQYEIDDMGVYSHTWCANDSNGNIVVEGIYFANIISKYGNSRVKELYLFNFDYNIENISNYNYHSITDSVGNFKISLQCLAFDSEISLFDCHHYECPTIGSLKIPYISKISVVHNDYPIFSTDWYDVDSNNGVFLNIDIP